MSICAWIYLWAFYFVPLAILIPACVSSSPAFLMMYSAYKLNKQGGNIQLWRTPFPIWNQSVVPCPVLTVASWPVYRFLKRQVRWSSSMLFYIISSSDKAGVILISNLSCPWFSGVGAGLSPASFPLFQVTICNQRSPRTNGKWYSKEVSHGDVPRECKVAEHKVKIRNKSAQLHHKF